MPFHSCPKFTCCRLMTPAHQRLSFGKRTDPSSAHSVVSLGTSAIFMLGATNKSRCPPFPSLVSEEVSAMVTVTIPGPHCHGTSHHQRCLTFGSWFSLLGGLSCPIDSAKEFGSVTLLHKTRRSLFLHWLDGPKGEEPTADEPTRGAARTVLALCMFFIMIIYLSPLFCFAVAP